MKHLSLPLLSPKAQVASVLVLGLLLTTTYVHAQVVGDGTGDTTREVHEIIPPGDDHYETPGMTTWGFSLEPIPADFFGPGCQPFGDGVGLQGVPLDPGSLGTTDTIVRRLEDANLPDPLPATDTIPIEIVALSLRSVAPITVDCGTREELWDIEVELGPPPQPIGRMTITKTHSDGGTYDAELVVRPLFIFTRVSDNVQQTLVPENPLQFSAENVPWDQPDCHPDILIPGDFCPSADPDGRIKTPHTQQPFDLVEGQWSIFPATGVPNEDEDEDGVADDEDLCPGTSVPEEVPTRGRLNPNHFALTTPDFNFDVGGRGRNAEPTESLFSLTDTRGCTCEQILSSTPGKQKGQQKYGCTQDTLARWINLTD